MTPHSKRIQTIITDARDAAIARVHLECCEHHAHTVECLGGTAGDIALLALHDSLSSVKKALNQVADLRLSLGV